MKKIFLGRRSRMDDFLFGILGASWGAWEGCCSFAAALALALPAQFVQTL